MMVFPDNLSWERVGSMSKYILLVDDDALMRRSLALILEQAGYRSSTAANAEDAPGMGPGARPSPVFVL